MNVRKYTRFLPVPMVELLEPQLGAVELRQTNQEADEGPLWAHK